MDDIELMNKLELSIILITVKPALRTAVRLHGSRSQQESITKEWVHAAACTGTRIVLHFCL